MKYILAAFLFSIGFGLYQYYLENSTNRYFTHNELSVFTNTGLKSLSASDIEFIKLVSPNNEKNSIRLESIYVAKAILPIEVTLEDAIHLCKTMGPGWRIATSDEYRKIFKENLPIWGRISYCADNVFFWTSDTLNSKLEYTYLFSFNEKDKYWRSNIQNFHFFIAVKNI